MAKFHRRTRLICLKSETIEDAGGGAREFHPLDVLDPTRALTG